MRERPILFSGEMVKAILEGRKTMTRRVVNKDISNQFDIDVDDTIAAFIEQDTGDSYNPINVCPYGNVGDRLWIKETWKLVPETACPIFNCVCQTINPANPHEAVIYKCGLERARGNGNWKPSIFMPRWASRILLEVTDIRVDRLQDITEEDAIAEGIHLCAGIDEEGCTHGYHWSQVSDTDLLFNSAADAYRKLWDSINGKKPGKTWQDNPWVWVVEFRRIEK